MTDRGEAKVVIRTRGQPGGKELPAGERCIALLKVRYEILQRLPAGREDLQHLLAISFVRRKRHTVAQAVGDGERAPHFPSVLDVGIEGVGTDVVDQRSAKRISNEVPIPSGDLRRVIQQSQK